MKLDNLPTDVGETLLKYSRKVLNEYVRNNLILDPILDLEVLREKKGIFCTFKINNNLRGCIGYPYPSYRLGEALVKSIIQSASNDPRFKPVTEEELTDIVIEITILSNPEEILVNSYSDYFNQIKLGEDGLIIEFNSSKGLLLPQVPIEQNWSVKEFLENICRKAHIPKDSWKDIENVKIYKFQGKKLCE